MTPDKAVEEVQKFGGTVIKTNLSHENETALREALASARPTAKPAADETKEN